MTFPKRTERTQCLTDQTLLLDGIADLSGDPDYHEIKVVMTDGTEFTTKSTWGKQGEILKLDVDPLSHPAWTGGGTPLRETGGVRYAITKYMYDSKIPNHVEELILKNDKKNLH